MPPPSLIGSEGVFCIKQSFTPSSVCMRYLDDGSPGFTRILPSEHSFAATITRPENEVAAAASLSPSFVGSAMAGPQRTETA
jgi:hypothetical protein